MILLSWQAQEYEDNTGEGDGGAGGQCYLIAHERGAGSMREQGAARPGAWQLGLCRA